MPRIWILAHTPFPREDGMPKMIDITTVISTAFFLFILNLSTKEDTTASIMEMELVSAAKNTSTKNRIPMIFPAAI